MMVKQKKSKNFIERMQEWSLPEKVYFSKALLGFAAAIIGSILVLIQFYTNIDFFAQAIAVGIGWALVPIHWAVCIYVLKLDLKEFNDSKVKILMSGIGAFLFIWLIVWTLWTTIWWVCVYGMPVF